MNRYYSSDQYHHYRIHFYFHEGISLREFLVLLSGDSWTLVKRFSSQTIKRAIRHNRLLPLTNRTRGDVDPTQQVA